MGAGEVRNNSRFINTPRRLRTAATPLPSFSSPGGDEKSTFPRGEGLGAPAPVRRLQCRSGQAFGAFKGIAGGLGSSRQKSTMVLSIVLFIYSSVFSSGSSQPSNREVAEMVVSISRPSMQAVNCSPVMDSCSSRKSTTSWSFCALSSSSCLQWA